MLCEELPESEPSLPLKPFYGLFDLVDGELRYGPRRAYALSRKFDEIFDENFVDAVLKDPPSCSPVGWRGFMLGRGEIWFNKSLMSFFNCVEFTIAHII